MELMEPGAKYLIDAQYKHTEVGRIPADWHVHKLADVADIRTGIAKNTEAQLSDPVELPYLRVANVQDGFLALQDVGQIRMSRGDVRRYLLQAGDVLMNEGGDLDKLGRGAVWQGQINPCVHQNHVFAVRCKGTLSPEFLNAWTSSAPARRFFMLAGRQTTNLASINKTSLGQLPIPIPSNKEEQEAIAKVLSDIDSLIASLEQSLNKKRLIKQGAMQELLTGKRRLPGFIHAWHTKKLQQLCRMKSGQAITNLQIDESSDFPCYGGNGIRGFTGTHTHDGTHVLIGRQGALCGNISIAKGKFFASEHAIVVSCQEGIYTEWLALALDRMNLNQLSESSAQPGLSVQKILALEVCVPSLPEQIAIAKVISDIDKETEDFSSKLTKARQLKQAMMQELLTGRIRLV